MLALVGVLLPIMFTKLPEDASCIGEEAKDLTSSPNYNTDQTNQENNTLWTGLKTVAIIWKSNFLHYPTFRRLFYLSFYVTMILFRTLLNRNMWLNPLSDVMGGWTLTDKDGNLTTEPIENLMLFVPFSVLFLWASKDKMLRRKKSLMATLWTSAKTVFLFSLSIEFLQLFLRLGTFQVSDLVYNTLGGMIGGMIYWIMRKVNSYWMRNR